MAKIRVYYDKAGKIQETEHRVAEDYEADNATRGDLKWLVIDSEELGDQSLEKFVVKSGKLAKKGR